MRLLLGQLQNGPKMAFFGVEKVLFLEIFALRVTRFSRLGVHFVGLAKGYLRLPGRKVKPLGTRLGPARTILGKKKIFSRQN